MVVLTWKIMGVLFAVLKQPIHQCRYVIEGLQNKVNVARVAGFTKPAPGPVLEALCLVVFYATKAGSGENVMAIAPAEPSTSI